LPPGYYYIFSHCHAIFFFFANKYGGQQNYLIFCFGLLFLKAGFLCTGFESKNNEKNRKYGEKNLEKKT